MLTPAQVEALVLAKQYYLHSFKTTSDWMLYLRKAEHIRSIKFGSRGNV